MRTRSVYLLKDEAFTGAQTKIINLNVADPISRIDVLIEMTNGSAMTEASVVKPHDEFVKIEIVNGSDVLCQGSMEEWQALNFVELGKLPFMQLTLEDDAVQQEMCHIHFGLAPNDPNHFLDPKRFKNPQIRITNTFTTAANTSWAAAGHTITVIAHVIEEGVSDYKGFLSGKSIYSYTAVDGAVEVIDMPRDYPVRLVMIQSLMSGYTPQGSIQFIKLTCDADKYVPLDVDADHQVMENVKQFGSGVQTLIKRMTNAGDIAYGDLYFNGWASGGGGVTLVAVHVLSVTGEQIVAETLGQT